LHRGVAANSSSCLRRLGLSDEQLGLVGGLAVTVFGTAFGVHIGRLADAARHRRFVLAACLVAFSISTAVSGAAQDFFSLLAARICVGVGEAGCIPVSLAILADAYPQERRSIASAFQQCCCYTR
jgi:MFS family permease